MRTWKIEIELELMDEVNSLEWIYQSIREQLNDGELLLSGKHIELEENNG
jgi:hypothetical protein